MLPKTKGVVLHGNEGHHMDGVFVTQRINRPQLFLYRCGWPAGTQTKHFQLQGQFFQMFPALPLLFDVDGWDGFPALKTLFPLEQSALCDAKALQGIKSGAPLQIKLDRFLFVRLGIVFLTHKMLLSKLSNYSAFHRLLLYKTFQINKNAICPQQKLE